MLYISITHEVKHAYNESSQGRRLGHDGGSACAAGSAAHRGGRQVGLAVDNGRLVVDPQPRPRYTLDELLAQCDGAAELTANDSTWLDDAPTGDELI